MVVSRAGGFRSLRVGAFCASLLLLIRIAGYVNRPKSWEILGGVMQL